ncbi:MAG: HAMP domain-containing histidine kinase [Burkholderiales bacterium]|nr:HAMP domain-containing histidine kinase [Burkholderiales bacterium]
MRFVNRRLSLRERVLTALAGIVAVFVGVQGLLAYLSLAEQEDDLADEWVMAEARRLAVHAERGELHGLNAGALFQPTPTLSAWLMDTRGHTLPGPVPEHLKSLSDGAHRSRSGGAELHLVVLPTAQGRLFVQYDATGNENKVDQFGIYMLGLGVLCVVLALAASHWIAKAVAAPIERVTEQLSNWAPDASMDAAASDEEAKLSDAFRRVQSRFEEAVAREREFVSNVRHEIRTPLTALRTDLELLCLAPDAGAPSRARLQRAMSMVDAVSAALESARVLSQRQGVKSQPIDLARCVDDAWSSLGAHASVERLQFVNAVPAGTFVDADRHSLLTILRNLIRNSAEHAAPARCVVSYHDQSIEVADDGPGIAPQDLELVFERYYRGRLKDSPGIDASGEGLGLAIAHQVAQLNKWTLVASSEPGCGARFVLRLA